MLKVDEIQNGVVIDHITAGTGLALYHMMELEKLNNASVAAMNTVPNPPRWYCMAVCKRSIPFSRR